MNDKTQSNRDPTSNNNEIIHQRRNLVLAGVAVLAVLIRVVSVAIFELLRKWKKRNSKGNQQFHSQEI
jgi:hypothetical protein